MYAIHKEVRRLRAFFVGLLLVSLSAIVMIAQGNPEAAKINNPVPATPESVAAGKQVYQRYCAACHGVNATGGTGNDILAPPPDLTDSEWKHGSSDGEIFYVIKNGVPPDLNMEPWGERIKDTEIWNIVNYLRTLAKK
jgi:mono/diheme cytochrome c family protein